jgi:hypothetical protein
MENQNLNKHEISNSILTIEQNNCNNSVNSNNKSINNIYKNIVIRDLEKVSDKKAKIVSLFILMKIFDSIIT